MGIPVDHRLVLDLLSSVSITERAQCLIEIVISRTDTSDHQSDRVTAQRALQQSSQFRLAIRNGLLARAQCRDHIAQAEQALVDLNALLEAFAGRLGLVHALRTGQVDQMEF